MCYDLVCDDKTCSRDPPDGAPEASVRGPVRHTAAWRASLASGSTIYYLSDARNMISFAYFIFMYAVDSLGNDSVRAFPSSRHAAEG